ncbi:phosphoglycerate dehydrogenase [Bradyrhizobium sp. HKCCYLS20291]|uniref:phosphoglycerate dehydrogenase n=1 Tax=Bradyrhizobium sp. HKCCYLS20291 TaxID=3420766 RepID=UPI003EC09DAF
MSFNVLVSTRFFDETAERLLRDNECLVRRTGLADHIQDDTLDAGALRQLLSGVDAWIVGTAPVTRNLMLEHQNLKVIARRGVGYDTVDTDAARELGRRVVIAPGGNEPAVADHAVGMMLSLAKRLREGHLAIEAGKWSPLVGTELFEKTVGLVGFGRIAQAVARRVRGFDATVLTYDPFPNREAAASLGARFVELPELLSRSDYVSLHLPLTGQTLGLFNEATLSAMKPGAILVNTARGGLVDEEALICMLKSGRLAGAGLDVFDGEADSMRHPRLQELVSLPNVLASAHAAGSSNEGLLRTNRIAAQTVIDILHGRSPSPHCVIV